MTPRIFKVIPMYGKVINRLGQKYRLIGSESQTKRSDGTEFIKLTWSSHCADCDAVFETTSTMRIEYLNRRCKKHKAKGKPVVPRNPKRKTKTKIKTIR